MPLETGTLTTSLLSLLVLWSIFWKGFALWIASKEDKKYWFIAILILNTAGILEIIYIFFFSYPGKNYIFQFKKHYITKKIPKKRVKKSEDKQV